MNRSVWNVRRRHEWLATPLKGKPLKKRKRLRIGLEQARVRKRETGRSGRARGDLSALRRIWPRHGRAC